MSRNADTEPVTLGAFTVDEERFEERQAEIRGVRTAVFTEEQGIDPGLDFDGSDADCIHVIARNATGSAVGTGRMMSDGHIGRLAVLQAYRGEGIGRALVDALVKAAHRRGIEEVFLHAQIQAVDFYKALGFTPSGAHFMEAGIEHVPMVRKVKA